MPFSASPDIAAQRQFTPSSTGGLLNAIAAALTPEGQLRPGENASADLTNFATFDNPANYSSTAGTIASVDYQINGVSNAGGGVLSELDTPSFLVTDSEGNTSRFNLPRVVFVQATAAGGLSDQLGWIVDDTVINLDLTGDFTANGNTLAYAVTGLPAGVVDDGDGSISGTPTGATSGTITITATDNAGRTTSSAFSYAASLRAQAVGGVDLDLAISINTSPTTDLIANWNDNGNMLTFVSVSPSLPGSLSVTSAGALTGSAPASAVADAPYTLTMQDEYGRQTSDTFTLEITAGFTPVANDRLVAWAHSDTSVGGRGEGTISSTSGSVSEWRDPRLASRKFVQATGSLQPRTGAETQNGVNVIDDNNDIMTMTGLSIDASATITAFVAMQTAQSAGCQFELNDGTLNNRIVFANRTVARIVAGGSAQANSFTQVLPSTFTIVRCVHTNSGSAFDRFENGVQSTGYPQNVGSTFFTTETLTDLLILDDASGGNALNGQIGEIRVYEGTLTSQEISDIETEMNDIWGAY